MGRDTGSAIRAARKANGMSLRALAEKLGVSTPFLCDVELNRRGAERHLGNICRVLGVPRDVLAASHLCRDEIEWIEARPGVLARLRAEMGLPASTPTTTPGGPSSTPTPTGGER